MARPGNQRSLRGRVAVVGIGETDYYRHSTMRPDPEFKLALKAILAACDDASLDPARSTASRHIATIAAMRRDWPRRWEPTGCAPPRCSGAEAAGDAVRRSPIARCVRWRLPPVTMPSKSPRRDVRQAPGSDKV